MNPEEGRMLIYRSVLMFVASLTLGWTAGMVIFS